MTSPWEFLAFSKRQPLDCPETHSPLNKRLTVYITMEWQGSNNDGPLSPKKKLHLKAKGGSLSDKVQDVRNDLKNARDISARNLLANLEKDNDNSNDNSNRSDEESSVEEVMVIEEETTEYVSEAECEEEIIEEEYYEEVEEEEEEVTDSEGSDLEPLPPPIAIPKALQVKDSSHKRESDDEEDDDDDEEEDDEEEIPPAATRVVVTPAKVKESPVTQQPAQEAKPPAASAAPQPKSNLRPSTIRGKSFEESPPPKPTVVPDEEEAEPTASPVLESVAPVAPKTPTNSSVATVPASSFVTPTKPPPAPTVVTASDDDLDENGRPKVEWTKPDWTKNTKLRATGKSAAGNLAKPITNLPHMGKENQDDTTILGRSSHHREEEEDQVAPAVTTSPPASSTSFKTPTASNKAKVTSAVTAAVAPKSAPQVRKPPASVPVNHRNSDDVDAAPPAIAWEKPDWAKKTVLRPTDKSDKIKSGQKLERPIGGIKPVD
jgi:hypothetical protein